MRRLALCLVVAGLAGGAGCGSDGSATTSTPVRAAAGDGERVVARSARLRGGRHDFVLMTLGRVGRVLVSCDAQAGPSVAFRADHLLATADVVVDVAGSSPAATTLQPDHRYQPAPAAAALLETWHIAPFAAANVRVTVLTVAARRLRGVAGSGCAASAHATVSASQGATREG